MMRNFIRTPVISKAFFALPIFLFAGCGLGGGGGGGGEPSGPAEVRVSAEPNNIDTGDEMEVGVELTSFREDALALKVRFPKGLAYVPNSTAIITDGNATDGSPDINKTDDTNRYLVFYLDRDAFGVNEDSRMEIFFSLEGRADVPSGAIAVDVDLDNPRHGNGREFDIDNPKFDAKDDTNIRVGEESSNSNSSSSSS